MNVITQNRKSGRRITYALALKFVPPSSDYVFGQWNICRHIDMERRIIYFIGIFFEMEKNIFLS